MDQMQEPGGILPQTEGEEHGTPARTAIPVVGVGASAGGLEVFKLLLAVLPSDTGFAIVFVQHLDPNHQSMLAAILARATAMPVSEAADGMPVEANHVYVMPANVDLTLVSGELRLARRTQAPGSHMPIDRFLRSVAEECGNRTIGVILSGAGWDGSAGLEAVKAGRGVTFVQEPATAKFGAMPRAAMATGCVDFVLPPEEIAAELARLGGHPYIADAHHTDTEPPLTTEEDQFARILSILHAATGIDFSFYRENMIRRRILRRLALRNIDGLEGYGKLLEHDSAELTALNRDLLISVTSFFRDPESFHSLKSVVFPRILEARSAKETVRVWAPGCATGEEAFSIAISLQEYFHENGATFPVQIFASDISLTSLERARAGRYLESISADVAPELLNRYFTKIEGGYQVSKSLREMCVFAKHNLIDDPPFSRLDLISCRNVLIYLDRVQKNIFPLFHYALRPVGFLMLGASESAAPVNLFSVADREHRIYGKKNKREKGARGLARFPARGLPGRAVSGRVPEQPRAMDVREEVDRILLSRYSPAGVVVDDDLEVLEIRGKAQVYLTLPEGKVSFNLLKLIPDTGLLLVVGKLMEQARKSGEAARQDRVPYDHNGSSGGLNVEVMPLDSSDKRSSLVLFEPVPATSGRDAEPLQILADGDSRQRENSRLKRQLAEAKERFLSAVEAHETAREESQSTTEEALSANEELQSLNEELETAKEELQSTNEELITVNDELQAKNLALAQSRDFALSIVETVRQPLLVLDTELRIRMANGAFCRTFRISPREAEGQVIFLLSQANWDLPGLRSSLATLLTDGTPLPDFEVEANFANVGRRSLVIGGCRINHLNMILLAVEDITERRLAEKALQRSQENLRQSQKMEAIGRLAGGIAHDFNNLLTAIIGYSDLLVDMLADNEPVLQFMREIKTAGDRAAALTQQLLAFSRRQVLQPKVLDLNGIVADFDRMLRRLVGERIKVIVGCEPALWQVRADPGEIGRAIMNLSLNARDAMPEGGTLSLETANVTVPETDPLCEELEPGSYVMMTVRDTGVGMSAEMQAHIFEPFFTTKETGKGTGLGLASVMGIVEQSGGVIRCDSEPGRGTAFHVFLPAVTEAADKGSRPAGGLAAAPKGTETILLVEDEDMVRLLARRVLEASGYVIYEARYGREGLELCESHAGPIDLLLTDVVMPELGGRELAETALRLRPSMKVMFMSGHTQDVILKEGIQKGTPFLQKPFTPIALAHKVRETLDATPNLAANA